jgi:hypothetical protein
MSSGQDPADDEDSKDTALAKKAEEQVAYKALRLTREKDNPFAIDMGNGNQVTDKRPLMVTGDKEKSLTVYQKARLTILSETFGVDIRAEADTLEYFKVINGREISLFTFDATNEGLAAAETSLKMAAQDLQKLLTAKFGVKFAGIDDESLFGKSRQSRQPGILELDAAGEALSVSDPAHLDPAKKPLIIYFVNDNGKQSSPVILDQAFSDGATILVSQQCMKEGNYLAHEIAKYFVEALAQFSSSKFKRANTLLPPEFTDALVRFRRGARERSDLFKADQTQYQQIKQLDQSEIDSAYGCLPEGTSIKLRLPNGRLASNSEAARDSVQQLEENA